MIASLDPCDFLQNERLNFCKWMFRIRKFAGRFSFQSTCSQPELALLDLCNACSKRLDSPIEFVIADDPGVVFEMIEQIDHQFALVSQADFSALIHVADVDQDRVWILPSPAPDLRSATRQPAAIRISVVIGGWQNMAVEVRRVQDRDANRVGVERRSSARQSWNRAEQSRPAGEFQKLPPSPVSVRVKHRLASMRRHISAAPVNYLNENARDSVS